MSIGYVSTNKNGILKYELYLKDTKHAYFLDATNKKYIIEIPKEKLFDIQRGKKIEVILTDFPSNTPFISYRPGPYFYGELL